MVVLEIVFIRNEALKNTSLGSYETCERIYKIVLSKNSNTKLSVCTDETDLQAIVNRNPDVVFLTNKLMVTENKTIWLSEYFEFHNIAYTGSIKTALQYDTNKIAAKLQVSTCGITTARFFSAVPNEYKTVENLPVPFPLFMKPLEAANSDGIDEKSLVINFFDFKAKLNELYMRYKQPVLVEQYLSGREFSVSIIKTNTLLIAPIEIVAPLENDVRILSQAIKLKNSEVLRRIRCIDTLKKVSTIAKASFAALGARDFGRIDIKMDAQENCYFMEANLMPGMTKGSSYFPESYELCLTLNYDDVIASIVLSAVKRSRKNEVFYEKT